MENQQQIDFLPQWFGAKINDGNSDNVAINNAIKFCNQAGGGTIFFPSGKYLLQDTINLLSNVHIEGEGDSTILHNLSNKNTIDIIGYPPDNRIHNIGIKKMIVEGDLNTNSGIIGINILSSFTNFYPRTNNPPNPPGNYYSKQRGDVINITDVTIRNHKSHGLKFEDGSQLLLSGCTIERNGEYGIFVFRLSNHLIVESCGVSRNGKSGIYINHVASNATITGSQFVGNKHYGVNIFGADMPVVSFCSFNQNKLGGIKIHGNNIRRTYGALVTGCLFADNVYENTGNASEIEISETYSASILSNVFYDLNHHLSSYNSYSMIHVRNNVKGCTISGNSWSRFDYASNPDGVIVWGVLNNGNEKVRFDPNVSYINQSVIFNDNNSHNGLQQVYKRNKYIQYTNDSKNNIVFQTKLASTDDFDYPNFILKNGGELSWGGGYYPTDIILKRINKDLMSISSNLESKTISIKQINSNEISRSTNYGTIFLDQDNKLKIKLPNGIIKTIKFE